MDNIKDDKYYLEKIVNDLEFIIKNTEGMSQDEIEANELIVDSIMFRIIQISENASKLTDDLKVKYKNVPWNKVKGTRNYIVHDYDVVEMDIIYNTVTKQIPNMYIFLKEVLDDIENEN